MSKTNRKKDNETYFAGQPSEYFVFAIRVFRSNISTRWDSSTAGSHSCCSSAVVSTAFQGSSETCSSPVKTANTILYTSSPALLEFRWTATSASSGTDVALAFPFCFGVPLSGVWVTRLHSPVGEVKNCRNRSSAAFSAEYHDCFRLGGESNDYLGIEYSVIP